MALASYQSDKVSWSLTCGKIMAGRPVASLHANLIHTDLHTVIGMNHISKPQEIPTDSTRVESAPGPALGLCSRGVLDFTGEWSVACHDVTQSSCMRPIVSRVGVGRPRYFPDIVSVLTARPACLCPRGSVSKGNES